MKKINPQTHANIEDKNQTLEEYPAATAPAMTAAQPVPLAMTATQLAAGEREKAALVEALRLPTPAAVPTPVELAEVFAEQPVTEDTTPPADVDAAVAARDRLQGEAARITAALAESEVAVNAARAAAAAHASAVAARKVSGELGPLRKRVEAQMDWLHALHREYASTLKLYAQSCASGSLAERTALMDIYGQAPGVQHRLATAYEAAKKALRLLEQIGSSPTGFDVEVASKASKSALAHDPAEIRDAAAALVERYSRIKGGGLPVVRIRLDGDAPAWRPGSGRPVSSDPKTDGWNSRQ